MSDYNRHVGKDEKKKNIGPVLKKVGAFVLVSSVILGAFTAVFFDSILLKTKIGESKYISSNTVRELISEYDVENPYIHEGQNTKEIRRMPHNNGRPIYVYVPDEILKQDRKSVV